MPDTAWKRAERRVAARLHGRRNPVRGRGESDVNAPGLAIEVKYRTRFPNWLKEAVAQAAIARIGGQLPAVVLVERGQEIGKALVLMALVDFEDWNGRVKL